MNTGLSEVIGSWKIIAMSRAADRAQLLAGDGEQVAALEQDLAGVMRARLAIRPHDDSAVTLLPEPDSPTMPSASPATTRTRRRRRRARSRPRCGTSVQIAHFEERLASQCAPAD